MKYDVHIFAIVRVKVTGVDADSQTEAIRQAEASVDLYTLFNKPSSANVETTEFADGISHYLVDEVGDSNYERSRFYEDDGETMLDFARTDVLP